MAGSRVGRSIVILAILITAKPDFAQGAPVCLLERSTFKSYAAVAGAVIPLEDLAEPHVTAEQHEVRGIRLCGYKISSYLATGAARRGHILFIQGSGMLASRMIRPLSLLSAAGFDVYVYDFRGYGCSGGKALIMDIFADYASLLNDLNRRHKEGLRALYGVSWGGIVALNAIRSPTDYDALVVDSTPDELPAIGFCPREINPERRLRGLGGSYSGVLLIANAQDDQVKPRNMHAMREFLKKKGQGKVHLFPDLGHPFASSQRASDPEPVMPPDAKPRMTMVASFLTSLASEVSRK